jgi:hypothetical protein
LLFTSVAAYGVWMQLEPAACASGADDAAHD